MPQRREMHVGDDHDLLSERHIGDPHPQYVRVKGSNIRIRRPLCFSEPATFNAGIWSHTENQVADDPDGDVEWLGNDTTAHRMLLDASDGSNFWGNLNFEARPGSTQQALGHHSFALNTKRLTAVDTPYTVEQGVDLGLIVTEIPRVAVNFDAVYNAEVGVFFTDITTAAQTPGGSQVVMQDINHYLYFGHSEPFEVIHITLTQNSSVVCWSPSIAMQYGSQDGWRNFGSVTEVPTLGRFTSDSVLTWDSRLMFQPTATLPSREWSPTTTFFSATPRYWVRIRRTTNAGGTTRPEIGTLTGELQRREFTVNLPTTPRDGQVVQVKEGTGVIVNPPLVQPRIHLESASDMVEADLFGLPVAAGRYTVASALENTKLIYHTDWWSI